jgi:hypothetical protein
MKKFFGTLLVLIILAAVGLFFGWAQLGVPPDSYGLIRSKTHGLDTHLVKPGEFRWIWYKLIPTNVTTTVFRLNPVTHAFSASNTLPSGGTYAAFAGIGGDFSWEIRAAFSFSLRPEALIPLVTADNIGTQEELDRHETAIAGQIETSILRRIDLLENLLQNGESPELERAIQEQFPDIGHFSLTVQSARFPDFALYRQTKELYEQYNALQKEFLYDDLREKAKSRVESFRRFDELEQYGALLTKYPILLEYLMRENSLPK